MDLLVGVECLTLSLAVMRHFTRKSKRSDEGELSALLDWVSCQSGSLGSTTHIPISYSSSPFCSTSTHAASPAEATDH